MSKYVNSQEKQNSNDYGHQRCLKTRPNDNSNNTLRKKLDENLAMLINNQQCQRPAMGNSYNTPNYRKYNNEYCQTNERMNNSPMKMEGEDDTKQSYPRDKYMKDQCTIKQSYSRDISMKEHHQLLRNIYIKQNNSKQVYPTDIYAHDQFDQYKYKQSQPPSKDCSANHRKQNARQKGFYIRVNNIECINQRISNLLDMVKKDKLIKIKQKQKGKEMSAKLNASIDSIIKYDNYNSYQKLGKQNKDKQQIVISHFDEHYQIRQRASNNKDHHQDRRTPLKNRAASVLQHRSSYTQSKEPSMSMQYCMHQPYISKYKSKKHYQQYSEIYKGTEQSYSNKYDNYSLYSKQDKIVQSQIKEINDTVLNYEKNQNKMDSQKQIIDSKYRFNDNCGKITSKSAQIDRIIQQKRKQRQRLRNKSKFGDIKKKICRNIQQQKCNNKQRTPIAAKNDKNAYEIYEKGGKFIKLSSPIRQLNEQKQSQIHNIRTSLLPVTMTSQQQYPYNKLKHQIGTTTTRVLDQQIQRIKSKLKQTQHDKYNKRLQHREKGESTGKLYKRSPQIVHNSPKLFQLKVYKVENTKEATVKMAEKLSDLVVIDSKCRTLRECFNKHQDQQKWQQLKTELQRHHIFINLLQLQDIMKISPDQNNPFSNDKNNILLNCARQLANVFAEAEQFWCNEVQKCVEREALKKEHFEIRDIDLNKKGYLTIEDLVCFINLYTGSFYRNRDISLIYKRFLKIENSNQKGIKYTTFVQKLAK